MRIIARSGEPFSVVSVGCWRVQAVGRHCRRWLTTREPAQRRQHRIERHLEARLPVRRHGSRQTHGRFVFLVGGTARAAGITRVVNRQAPMRNVCPETAFVKQMKPDEADRTLTMKHDLTDMACAPQELRIGLIEPLAEGLDAIDNRGHLDAPANRCRVDLDPPCSAIEPDV